MQQPDWVRGLRAEYATLSDTIRQHEQSVLVLRAQIAACMERADKAYAALASFGFAPAPPPWRNGAQPEQQQLDPPEFMAPFRGSFPTGTEVVLDEFKDAGVRVEARVFERADEKPALARRYTRDNYANLRDNHQWSEEEDEKLAVIVRQMRYPSDSGDPGWAYISKVLRRSQRAVRQRAYTLVTKGKVPHWQKQGFRVDRKRPHAVHAWTVEEIVFLAAEVAKAKAENTTPDYATLSGIFGVTYKAVQQTVERIRRGNYDHFLAPR